MGQKMRKNILLVEDEFLIAAAERMSLESYGYRVTIAKNADEAINLFNHENNIDLILMDIDLGKGMDGTEVAENILEKADIPVVFLSSHSEPEIVEKTEKITSYGYVVKNSNITVLDASIKMAFKLFDANKRIHESEMKQKSMISNISDAICIIDNDCIIKYISPNIFKLFTWNSDDLVGHDWFSMVAQSDVEYVKNEFRILSKKAGSTVSMEFLGMCGDGSGRHVEMTASNLTDDPAIRGFLLNYHDISKRKLIETALNESKYMFQQLIESLPQKIFAKDVNGNFMFANQNYCMGEKRPVEDIIGKTDFDLHPADFAVKYRNDDQEVIESNRVIEFEEEHIPLEGDKSYVQVIKAPFHDSQGGIIGVLGIFWDITERKRVSDALRKTERIYYSLFNNMNEGFALHVMIYDANGKAVDFRYLDVNDSFERLTGLKRDNVVGERFSKILPEELDFWVEKSSAIIAGGKPMHFEYFLEKLEKYYEVSVYSPVDDQFAVIFKDITDSKRAEIEIENKNLKLAAALDELEATNEELTAAMEEMEATNEELFTVNSDLVEKDKTILEEKNFSESVIESLPGFFYVYDEQGRLLRWNKKHEEMTGYTSAELSKMTVADWYDGDDMVRVTEAVKKVFSTGYAEIDANLMLKDGSTRLVHSNGVLVEINGKKYLTGVGVDITENRYVQEALSESEYRLQRAVSSLVVPVIIHDEEDRVLQLSSGWTKFSGYTVDDIPTFSKWMKLAFHKGSGMNRDFIAGLFKIKDTKHAGEWEIRTKDGKTRVWEFHTTPLGRVNMGKKVLLTMAIDVTDTRNFEKKIGSLLEEKDILLKEVHHRIKNNMNTIHSLLSLQSNTLRDPLTRAAFKDAGNRIRSMILLYDKLYRSSDFREISVREYISLLVDEIIGNFPNSGSVTVEKKIDDFMMDAKTVQTLGIIINELLTNIMKYAFIGRENGKISIVLSEKKGSILCSIRDNGNGIPESVDFETSESFGMKLVGMMTQHLDGKIEIRRGRGSEIILRFPL